MSIKLPIQTYDGEYQINDFGTEFEKMQNIDRDRGLLDPISRDPIFSKNNTYYDYNLTGIDNQDVLLQNNYDPSEENIVSNEQAMQYIKNHGSLKIKPTLIQQQLETEQTYGLDQRLVKAMTDESNVTGSNIFNQQSQDYVNQVKTSVKAYDTEQNLYYSKLQLAGRKPLDIESGSDSQQIDNELFDSAFDFANSLSDIEKKLYKDRMKAREGNLPRKEPSQESKYNQNYYSQNRGYDAYNDFKEYANRKTSGIRDFFR